MADIQIPGYSPLVDNWIYWRELPNHIWGAIAEILTLTRFNVPTKEETIEDVIKIAKKPLKANPTRLILPEEFTRRVAERSPFALEILTKCYRENLQPGNYLQARTGILPHRYIHDMQHMPPEKLAEVDITERALIGNLGQHFSLALRLESGNLPKKEELTSLLSADSVNSPTLEVIGDSQDKKELLEYIDLIYNCLGPKTGVSPLEMLRDSSEVRKYFIIQNIFKRVAKYLSAQN